MKEIRLCDGSELSKVFKLCVNNNLGVEIQGFYNPNLIDTQESQNMLLEYKKLLKDFKGGKSLHAPFWDLNLGSKHSLVRDATMKAFNYIILYFDIKFALSFYPRCTTHSFKYWCCI